MFSHMTVGSNDMARSKAFYDGVTGALGLVRHIEFPDGIGYGLKGGRPQLWIVRPLDKKTASVGNGITIGLEADTRAAVVPRTPPASRRAAATKAGPACARITIRTITAPMFAIRKATRSASFATGRREAYSRTRPVE